MMSRLLQGVRSSTSVRNIALLTSGTIVAQAINIVATPILSRIYTPADFGLVGVYTAVVTICATLITLRYELRVLLPDTDSEARSVVILALVLAVTLGGVLTASTTILPGTVQALLGLQQLGTWLPVAILASIAAAIISSMNYWFSRCGQYIKMTALRIAQTVLLVTLSMVLGFLAVPNGLLYAQVTTLAVSLLMFMYCGYASLVHPVLRQSLVIAAKKHNQAPLFLMPTALLNVLTIQLPFVVLSTWFSSDAAGQYRMAWTLLALPSSLVGSAIAQVFFQRFSSVWPDVVAAKALLFRTWTILAILGVAPLTIVMLFGEQLFALVLGNAWRDSGVMAAILAPMVFMSLIHSPTSTTFVVMGLESKLLFFGIAVAIYRPLCLYLGKYFNNLYLGLALFVVAEIVQMLVFQYITVRKLNSAPKSI